MFDDTTPIYRQIADEIRQQVVRGELVADEQVQSTNQYAAFHRINPATVNKGFQLLVDEGVIYKKRGLGMFVAPDAAERLREEQRASFLEDRLAPVVLAARHLDISVDELIAAVRTITAQQPQPPSPSPAVATSATTAATARRVRPTEVIAP